MSEEKEIRIKSFLIGDNHMMLFDTEDGIFSREKDLLPSEIESLPKPFGFLWTKFSKESGRELWEMLNGRGYNVFDFEDLNELQDYINDKETRPFGLVRLR